MNEGSQHVPSGKMVDWWGMAQHTSHPKSSSHVSNPGPSSISLSAAPFRNCSVNRTLSRGVTYGSSCSTFGFFLLKKKAQAGETRRAVRIPSDVTSQLFTYVQQGGDLRFHLLCQHFDAKISGVNECRGDRNSDVSGVKKR